MAIVTAGQHLWNLMGFVSNQQYPTFATKVTVSTTIAVNLPTIVSEAIINGDLRKLQVNLFHPCVVCGSFLSSGSNLNKHIGRKHVESQYKLCI